jgi:hypothetical protein
MMPESLLHQTLAKLISETGRSHLFYFSLNRTHYNRISKLCQAFYLVWVERFELPTSCSQSRRSTRLSYTQINLFHQFLKERLLLNEKHYI